MQDIAPGADGSETANVRVHITPFNPDLLDKILPPSVRALAKDISFHTVETFPERGFGYVELPAMEAQKLKKKLNGSTLRGAKVRIEDAKPEKKRKSDVEEAEAGEKKARRAEKKQREEGVLPGHELEEGRRIKRGWTEGSKGSKKKDNSSKAADDADSTLEGKRLRFKTSIPPNMSPIAAKQKKSKEGQRSKDKTVVQEFRQSSTPRTGDKAAEHQPAVSYEDGRGWMDEAGNLVDAEPKSRRRKSSEVGTRKERRISAIESRETQDAMETTVAADSAVTAPGEDIALEDDVADSVVAAEPLKEVHPLEALFKRPAPKASDTAKPRPRPINTSFSFFDVPAAEEEDLGVDMPPQTPHTKRDLEWRSIRSAAPTPDTAAIGRHFSFPSVHEDEDDDEDDANAGAQQEERDAEVADVERPSHLTGENGAEGEKGEESAFRKWFYESRGDLNRSWKKRRREEKKVERQRENKRLSRKVA